MRVITVIAAYKRRSFAELPVGTRSRAAMVMRRDGRLDMGRNLPSETSRARTDATD